MIVVIRDMSAGNAETGDAWQETKIFEETATLGEVMKWATLDIKMSTGEFEHSHKRITITRSHE